MNEQAQVFQKRRKTLLQNYSWNKNVLLFLGGQPSPKNYPENTHFPFKQDGSFLYYTGIKEPNYALLMFSDGKEVLFGTEPTMDHIVWEGGMPSLQSVAESAGISSYQPLSTLQGALLEHRAEIGILPPYQGKNEVLLCEAFHMLPTKLSKVICHEFKQAVIEQRLVKTEEEISELHEGFTLTGKLHQAIMQFAREGRTEAEIAGLISHVVFAKNRNYSFQPIATVRGEILHPHTRFNTLQNGQLLLVDMGVDSPHGYASDMSRTSPVSGSFTELQRSLYQAVLSAQQHAIAACRPGVSFRDLHLQAASILTNGLIDLGFMKGNAEDIVDSGAHALFFPHGLGHALGIDVHDMEDLGDYVGYMNESRSQTFGLSFLRYARDLQEGHVVTIEPGFYAIPALIEQWRSEGKHSDFLCYDKIESHLQDFGGIRLEDTVVVTEQGARILGESTPIETDAVEACCAETFELASFIEELL